ncbi:hypothetical protein F4803DRAFT_510706 [Xylaria telfairii]|nr:hypothetical protein F4803DRAFT_510706 [Xylaria telfairii]
MYFTKIAVIFSGLLASSEAVSIRFHALNHCKKSHVDLVCPHIHSNVCCKPPGINARSITFLHGKGDIGHSGTKNCKTAFKNQLHHVNVCFFHTSHKGRWHSAFFDNPLGNKDAPVSANGDDNCCTQTVEPTVAIVNDNASFNIADMSPEQLDTLYALANNDTSVDIFPSDLSGFMVPTEDWSDDIAYIDSADESQ